MSSPRKVRWGIMATGGIARSFVSDMLLDSKTRGVEDVVHEVVAVASSSNKSSAEKFISEVVKPAQSSPSAAYGSYEELVKDPDVEIIYVASPHSHHYQNCMLCLSNGKAVLCEKALTVNSKQSEILYKTAKEKNLFFMEAVWTRYFPLSIAIRKHIQEGDIGEVIRVVADNSIGSIPEDDFDLGNRMVNLDLAGGCLLDLGIYSLTWVFQTLYHTIPAAQRHSDKTRPVVKGAAMTPEPRTGADESILMLLEFPRSVPTGKTRAHAVATSAMRSIYDGAKDADASQHVPSIRIYGEKGEIQVFGPAYQPTRYRLVPYPKTNPDGKLVDRTFEFEAGGRGMFYEADEAARCYVAGKLESASMTWNESQLIMEVMDQTRELVGLKYPEAIESTQYPLSLAGKKS